MGKKKPKTSIKPKETFNITPINDRNTKVLFSFEYLDLKSSKYSLNNITQNNIKIQFNNELLKKLTEYSQEENFRKFINDNGVYRDRNHIHQINWNDIQIKEKCFTSLPKKLMEQVQGECWQLGINSTTFRIHGFFIENVFYIVWLDPTHSLYAQK